jgi:dienelactone hydrolase
MKDRRFFQDLFRLHFVRRAIALTIVAAIGLSLAAQSTLAAGPRVLEEGKLPDDARLKPLKDLNGYFPFEPAKSPEEWAKRSAAVRRQLLVALGLWPMPEKTPLNEVIHGRVTRDDYTVEKVYFESFPGFYVTGSLYRPVGKSGKLPGVLCPHGHWSEGRFHDAGRAAVRKQIVEGAERFEEGGRSPLQARCVQLARMGCVVFHYDMIGYADSTQLSFELAHRFGKQRPEMNTPENWGLYSPQSETHLQSIMGLQSYSSVRALDFLIALPDVDASRVAVTGASGGGTQTFLLCAIDPRPALAIPAVMVSTAMQGGCTCENCSLLRVETGNVEFAALFAPKPQGLTAANDWTKEMETKGFPQLQQHYKMLGAEKDVNLKAAVHFGHNYNYVSRSAMYGWVNKYFKLGLEEPVVEEDYQRLTKEELTVWDSQHPQPEGGPEFERKLLHTWTDDAEKQLAALTPKDEKSLRQFREVVGGAVDAMIGRGLPAATDVEYEQTEKTDRGSYLLMAGLLRNKAHGEVLPIVFLYPKQWDSQAVIWLHEQGKAGLFDKDGQPNPEVKKLLANGATVVGVDLLYQGEFLSDGKPLETTRRVNNTREFAGYTFGFNHAVFAQRVHDILTVITFVRNHELTPKTVDLVGLDATGPLAAAARAQARDAVDRAVINTGGFRFGKLTEIHDVNFLPGGAKYGDVPGMLALSAPSSLWLAGEGNDVSPLVKAAYAAAGGTKNVQTYTGKPDEQAAAAVSWLLTRSQN